MAAAGCVTGVGAEAARSIAAIMSPLVTRPSLPEPGTVAASMPLSAASLRTEGASGTSGVGDFAGAGAAGFSTAGAVAVALGAPTPSLICPSKAPTATVSPSLAAISPSTPAAGAGTSMVTLSVSSSTSGSSTATGSPGFLNHLPIVASVTDSPSVGTRISVMIYPIVTVGWAKARSCAPCPRVEESSRRERTRGHGAAPVEWREPHLGPRLCPPYTLRRPLSQRLVEQRLELLEVQRHLADRGGRRGGASGIGRALVLGAELLEHPFEIRLQERERAHVARLLLAPHELRLLEAAELLHQCLQRHRIELLDAQEIDVVDAALLPLLVEVVVDLARAHHDAAD